MRVLLVTPNYPWEGDPVSGAFYRTQAQALVAAGASVTVVRPVPWVPTVSLGPRRWSTYASTPRMYSDGRIEVMAPRVIAPPRDLRLGIAYAGVVRAVARTITRMRPDVVHGHFAYPSGLAAAIAGERYCLPSVVTLHGSDVHTIPSYGSRPASLFRKTLSMATSVIAVSGALAMRAEEIGGRRPIVMPIGVDVTRFTPLPSREAARVALGLPADAFVALFVGQLSAAKGVPELLESLDLLPREIICAFVGDGPLRAKVRANARARHFGVQPPMMVPEFMAASDLLVLPSHAEGLPTVLAEAGAAGRAVLATPVGGVPEMLGQGRGTLLPRCPASPQEIAAAIVQEARDTSGRGMRAAALHAHVCTRYDARRNAEELLTLYERLCAKCNPGIPP